MNKNSLFNRVKSYKNAKGIVVTDAIIAILIVLLFVGIITSFISKIATEKYKIKINSQQMSLSTQIMEHVEKSSYEDVTQDKLIEFINEIDPSKVSAGVSFASLTTPNKVKVLVESYKPEGEDEYLDLVKIITISIQNELDNQTYTTELSRIKKASPQEVKAMLEN